LGCFVSEYRLCLSFEKKLGWATFWAIFSQTHLITLPYKQCQLKVSGGSVTRVAFEKLPGTTKCIFFQRGSVRPFHASFATGSSNVST
jgi:hypothetical protein